MAGRQNTGICSKLNVTGYLGVILLHSGWPKLCGVLASLSAIEYGHLCYSEFGQNVLSLGGSKYGRKT